MLFISFTARNGQGGQCAPSPIPQICLSDSLAATDLHSLIRPRAMAREERVVDARVSDDAHLFFDSHQTRNDGSSTRTVPRCRRRRRRRRRTIPPLVRFAQSSSLWVRVYLLIRQSPRTWRSNGVRARPFRTRLGYGSSLKPQLLPFPQGICPGAAAQCDLALQGKHIN